ncbi:VWD domain-containing protein [Spirosoma sp.]|uniref:VWD domain-containing protein n=1 Tax=Spirosoma sp. TaxID=1899569 RepID=UPI003B3A2612
MKRIISILLLIGLGLPMLFEGCKKPESDPVAPTPSSTKDSTIFSTLYIGCNEANGNKGLLLLYTQQDLIKSTYQPVKILGADYLRFSYKNYTEIYAALQVAHATLIRRDPVVKTYSSAPEFWENSFKSKTGFVKRQSLTKEQAVAFLNQETIQLVRASGRPVPWQWTDPLEAILTAFVTPAQAKNTNSAQAESWFGHVSFESVLEVAGGIAVGVIGLEIGGAVVIGVTSVIAAGFVFDGFKDIYNSLVGNPAQRAVDAYNRGLSNPGSSGPNGNSLWDAVKGFFGMSSGDPHLVTLDKVKYDFQAMGEFIAMKSTTDKFEVQVRYGAQGESSVTFNQAIAINTGADIISCDFSQTYVYVNKQKITLSQINEKSYALPGGGNLIRSSGILLITTPNKDQVAAIANGFYFKPADNRKGKLAGLFGNFDDNQSNDGRTRDNKVVNLLRPDELYPAYADSWRITQAESLFFYENGATTETYTDRTKPNNKRPFASLSLTERQSAEAICRQAGVTREPELSNCILDVAITGDASYATLASVAAKATPTDNNFIALADFPGKAAEGAVGLTVSDKIYAGLGKTSVDWAMYDPATDMWTAKTPFPAGKTSYGRIGTFVIGNKIYCVGGVIDGTMTNALWEYDTNTDKWTRRKDLPGVARYNIATFATGGKGYALFGANGWGNVGDFPTNSAVFQYDPATDNWTQKADFPSTPRGNNITSPEFNGMVMVINGRPFLGGGSGGGTTGKGWYEYIPARDVWEKRADSVFDDGQYFGLGSTGYLIRGNALFSYDATTDTWSKFPGKEIYLPLASNALRGIKQVPVLNGKAYLGLGYQTSNVGNKEWWSFTP